MYPTAAPCPQTPSPDCFVPVSLSSSAGNPAVTGAERKSGLRSDPEGAFHYAGYPVALIVSSPPVVRYLPAYPSKIVCQLLKKFSTHTPILAWFFDTLNSCLTLGQLATEEKSNEITAIPTLLEMIAL
jgi:hypothetical protein